MMWFYFSDNNGAKEYGFHCFYYGDSFPRKLKVEAFMRRLSDEHWISHVHRIMDGKLLVAENRCELSNDAIDFINCVLRNLAFA